MKKCENGNHTWVEINREYVNPCLERVINWCAYCGSITLDGDSDGRISPGYFEPIKNPEIVKILVKQNIKWQND